MHHIFFNHSSVHAYLGCFHVFVILNSAPMNVEVHVSFQIRVFIFSRYILRSEMAGSYLYFYCLSKLPTVFCRGCTSSHCWWGCNLHFLFIGEFLLKPIYIKTNMTLWGLDSSNSLWVPHLIRKKKIFIYFIYWLLLVFIVVLGFSLVTGHGLLIAMASLAVEHNL